MANYFKRCFIFAILFFNWNGILEAKPLNRTPNKLTSPQSTNITRQSLSNIGNWAYWFWYDGRSGHDPHTGGSGGIYPRGTMGVVYQDGLVWGGITRDTDPTKPQLRVGGNTYRNGTQPGWYGGDPNDERARIYRIRRDWASLTRIDVLQDVAEINGVTQEQVTDVMIDEVIAQYKDNWKNWPTDLGAPYYDADDNGAYNPVLDSNGMPVPAEYDSEGNLINGGDYPGIAQADQVLWFVINDDNEGRVEDLTGSPPLGLEVQITIWAYAQPESNLGQVIYKKYKIINKSSFTIDSMHISQWIDPDIGDYSDDLVGCDSILQYGFAYNGNENDYEFSQLGLTPPAIAYTLLQGPIVPSPGDSAFFNGQFLTDYKNLPMTSFAYFGSGTVWPDPIMGDYDGTLQWYNLLRGFAPTTDVDNVSWFVHTTGEREGQKTKFPLNGDPVMGQGDIDGVKYSPGDRRLLLCSGPFTMHPDDVQEVVVAVIGGNGINNLNSLLEVKNNVELIRDSYGRPMRIPWVSWKTKQPNNYSSELFIQADLTDFDQVNGCEVQLRPQLGSEVPFTLVLYDDGMHNDGQAGDNVWANSVFKANKKYPYAGDFILHLESGDKIYKNYITKIRLRPVPILEDWRVVWENAKQDGQINHSESAHLRFDIRYPGTELNIDTLSITYDRTITLKDGIPAGGISSGETQYFNILGPSSGDSLYLWYRINFDYHTAQLKHAQPVVSAGKNNHWMDTVSVLSINGTTDNVLVMVADQSLLTTHTYAITFNQDSTQTYAQSWNLHDLTTGKLLLSDQPLANRPDFPHPVVDGLLFKVKKADEKVESFELVQNGDGPLAPPASAAASWQSFPVPDPDYNIWPNMANGSFWFIHTWPNGSRASFDAFMDRTFQYTGGYNNPEGTGIKHLLSHDFEIRFTGNGKAFDEWVTGTIVSVPFELWDIGDPNIQNDDYQLVPYLYDIDANGAFNLMYDRLISNDPIGWADHEVSGGQNDPWTDPIYWMHPVNSTPGTEGYDNMIAAIEENPSNAAPWYAKPGTASGAYDCWAGMHRIVLVNWNGGDVTTANSIDDYTAALPDIGSVFRIVMSKQNYKGDSLLIYGPSAIFDDAKNLPKTFHLAQNYPNPFNPLTTIAYQLPKRSRVKLEIFNILGQRVQTLVNAKQAPGHYKVKWDASRFATGMYIYRLNAGEFTSSKKLLFIK